MFGLLIFPLSCDLKLTSLGLNSRALVGYIVFSFDQYVIIGSIVLLALLLSSLLLLYVGREGVQKFIYMSI